MATMPGWIPFHENHAIDVMAVVVTYAQPIPDLLLRKVLHKVEPIAMTAGLNSRHGVRGMQLLLGSDGKASASQGPMSGRVFNALAEPAAAEPVAAGRVGEQLQVDQSQVLYRTWRYVSWTWQLERIKLLMAPVLQMVGSTVSYSTIRLEYLDRFRFDGDINGADPKQLIRQGCPLVAPHVFDRKDLWHSHTAAFVVGRRNKVQQLQMVNLDAVNDPPVQIENHSPSRFVNITTALEDRFDEQQNADIDMDPDYVFGTLDSFHDELKALLGAVITDQHAQRIYLHGATQ